MDIHFILLALCVRNPLRSQLNVVPPSAPKRLCSGRWMVVAAAAIHT